MNDIYLEKVIEDFDLINFLDENGINYALETKNVGSGWLGVETCPSCSAENFHFGINQENKSYSCWQCGTSGNLIAFISLILNISYNEARDYLLDEFSSELTENIELAVKTLLQERKPKVFPEKKTKEIYMPRSMSISSKLIKTNPIINSFFKERRLTKRDVNTYDLRIGLSGLSQNRLIIPVYKSKKLIGYQTRSFTKKYYITNGPLKHNLYNYDNIPKHSSLILVEGFFDFHNVSKFLEKYYNHKYFVLSPFSKIITEEQIKLIRELKPKEIISFLDRDAWFQIKFVDKFMCESKFIIPPSGEDPGSMTHFQLLHLFRKNNL